MKKTFILAVSLLLSIGMYGQYPFVKNFTKDHYHGGTQNWSITEGFGNCMYIANNSGLLEFDGTEWKNIPSPNETIIRSLYYDNIENKLYTGATNELGYYEINQTHKMTYTSLTQGKNIGMAEIWDIKKLDGNLYFHDNRKICCLEKDGFKIKEFNDQISCISIVDNQLLVVVQNCGIFRLENGRYIEVKKFNENSRWKRSKICEIIGYKDKYILITESDGICIHGKYEQNGRDNYLLQKKDIFCAAIHKDILIVGTISEGIYILNLNNMSIKHVDMNSGLQNNTILSLYFDSNEHLWLCQDNGIDLISINFPEESLFDNTYHYGAGYASAIFDGKLYLGTNQGLFQTTYSGKDQQLSSDNKNIKKIKEVYGQVWSLQVIGNELFCCYDKGICIISANGSKRHIFLDGAWKIVQRKQKQHTIIGASYSGLFYLIDKNGEWEYGGKIEGFNDTSKEFIEDKDGKIWLAHWIKGLYRLTLSDDCTRVTDIEEFDTERGLPAIRNIGIFEYENRILFSTEGGIYKYDEQNGKMARIDEINNEFSTAPGSINVKMLHDGSAYYSSGRIQSYCYKDPSGKTINDSLTLKPIIKKRMPGFEQTLELPDNNLLINTIDGFSIIDTDKIKFKKDRKKNKVFIKEICDGRDSCIFESRDNHTDDIVLSLPYEKNTMTFKFKCPDFSNSDAILYSCKLENYDKEWSNLSKVSVKEYTGIPHGDYKFNVKSRNMFTGDESYTGIRIKIQPPWYATKLAWILYILIFLSGICVMYYSIKCHYMKRAAILMSKKEEEVKKKQMEMEIGHKAQDLAATTMNVIRKNEILLTINNDIERILDDEKDAKIKRQLTKIRTEIRENIEHDNDWKKFEENFDIVYDDFIQRLGKAYPKLTINDKKMCAYLKMNLSTKEISPLLNLTVRSVEMSRYRLRKKLNLEREDNLTEFLQKF